MLFDLVCAIFVLYLTGVRTTLGSSHFPTKSGIIRHSRDTYWNDQPALYAPLDMNVDKVARSPVLMELHRDLVPANGPGGIYGICNRVYRVLYDTHLPPVEECRRHHNSRQSYLGDITEFYHTLVESGLFNRTIEFPLADRFKRFTFRASFVHLPSKGSEPAVLIETVPQSRHVVCVESIKCPTTTTITSPTELPTAETLPNTPGNVDGKEVTTQHSKSITQNRDAALAGGVLSRSSGSSTAFWDTLLSGTEPKSWFLATVSLSGLCVTLLVVLLVTWLYVCRLRLLHARRRCRGTCRFGCRCPPELIRQAVNNAAVHGPLDSQNVQLFGCPLTPQGNGSIRSGSGFGATMFSGGTMTSSRWGSNGCQKMGSPLYVSLANAVDKTALLTNCSIPAVASGPMESMNESLSLANGQRPSSQTNRRRTSQNAICRSTSDGSSISEHPVPNCGSKAGVGNQVRACLAVGFPGGPTENCCAPVSATPTMLMGGVNTSRSVDSCGSLCYQTPLHTCFAVSEAVRKEGTGPLITQSPTQLATRKTVDRYYHNSSACLGNSAGPVREEDEEEPIHTFYASVTDKAPMEVSKQQESCVPFNSRVPNSFHQTNLYPVRGSDSDLLNITPPSGFYDPNNITVDSGLVNGSLTSSSFRSSNQNDMTGYGVRSFTGSSLYPVLGSPRNNHVWNGTSPGGEMVGAVELAGVSRAHPANFVPAQSATGPVKFKPTDFTVNSVSKELTQPAPKQMLSPRLFAATERML